MSYPITLNTEYVDIYLWNKKSIYHKLSLDEAHKSIQEKTCLWSEYLGWVDVSIWDEEISQIQKYIAWIQSHADVLIVCGIGGSYLGARALIESLDKGRKEVVFLGNHLSGWEYEKVFKKYRDKDVAACIISKSGTTMETAISYRLVYDFLIKKYTPAEIQKRIITITDEKNGALRTESNKKWYISYILPADIGGRYSVLTPVGLIPCSFSGIDNHKLLAWARRAKTDIVGDSGHPAFTYAQKRADLEEAGFVSELFITSEPSLYFIGEWWKQLMGESHGKQWRGLYPDTLSYTTDLHSLGQYVQEGRRLFFETMLWIKNPSTNINIPAMSGISDSLDALAGRPLHDLNLIALESTAKAHNDGWCPSMTMTLDKLDEYNLWYFIYTMMYACALSGIMLGVNPFNQPGVEAYKNEMRKRLQ